MIRLIKIQFILLMMNLSANSQGFDWQYSPRLPFETPDFFIGIDISSAYNLNSSNFEICEQDIVCDVFTSGEGFGYAAGLKAEYWAEALTAYFVNINYLHTRGVFTNLNTFPYPPETGDKILEYEYLYKHYSIAAEIGFKYRLTFISDHIFSSISIRSITQINSSNEFILRRISEAEWLNEEIHFTDFDAPQFSSFILMPELKIGYDLNMGLGSYTSVYIGAGIPLYNFINDSKEGDLRRWSFSAGISFFPMGFIY